MVLLVAAAPMAETPAATILGREKALLGKAIEVDLEMSPFSVLEEAEEALVLLV
jgi:hypothetical protein